MKTINFCFGALVLLAFIASTQSVSVQRISPSKLIVTAANYELRFENTTISMHTRRKSTRMIRENDYLQYSFLGWSDDIFWSLSPNNGTAQCSRTTTPAQNFTAPSELSVAPGPGGTTLASTTVTFGENCNLSAIFYVSDVDTSIVIDGYTNSISADEAKLSVRLQCPWRSHLAKYANVSLDTPVWGRGRSITVYSYFNVISSSGFNDFPRSNFSERLRGWEDFPDAAATVCGQVDMTNLNTREYPTPSIWPNYDFSRESLLFFSSPESLTTVGFLTWAVADQTRRVRVGSTFAEDRSITSNGLGFIYWPVNIRLEGYNSVEYDPSLLQIFYEDEAFLASGNAPGVDSPRSLTQSDGLTGAAIAGIAVAVIAPIAIAAAAVWFFLRQKQERRTKARIMSELKRARTLYNEGTQSMQKTEKTDAEEKTNSTQQDAGWAKASKSGNVTNVRASKV